MSSGTVSDTEAGAAEGAITLQRAALHDFDALEVESTSAECSSHLNRTGTPLLEF